MSESLILAVQEHEMLYAPSHREYKNAKKKLLVWDVIGESLHMTVGVYFVAFVAVSTPTKATKDLAFPAVYRRHYR